jgi:hypothetical protein
MTQKFVGLVIGMTVCFTVSLAHGQGREKSGEKQGGAKQGGSKTGNEKKGGEAKGDEKKGSQKPNDEKKGGEKPGANKPPGGNWSDGKPAAGNPHHDAEAEAAAKNKSPQNSAAGGAAAGAAAANRNSPSATGAQGAAAGAAATNRNQPPATAAQGAAAGAAAANRNAPQTTGAEGAAAGAAAANRNSSTATGAQGAAAGAALANRNTPTTTNVAAATAGYAAVRSSFNHPEIYGQSWYASNPGAWTAPGLASGAAWTPSAWGSVASICGYASATPISYNYGGNVTNLNGNVVQDGQSIGTAEQFSQQAADLAAAGTEAQTSATDKWLPLGVFALVRDQQEQPHLILQMAVNQQGTLRGNYTDEATEHTSPIHGGVDSKTQRVAWTVGSNPTAVMEAGLSNLTAGEAPALLHKNGTTERWALVRLQQP